MPLPGPNLDDPALFDRRAGVPILDTHERHGRVVDAARLHLVCQNSNARVARGELGLVLLGHTIDDAKEIDQPPLAGFARNYQMGQWQGNPCLFADLFIRKDKPEAFDFPRRSVEVYYSDRNPAENYVDAISLLRRSPERDLGMLTYRSGRQFERYSMADSDPVAAVGLTDADIEAFVAFQQSQKIADTATALRKFLQAKEAGTLPPEDVQFTAADVDGIQKYAKLNKIDLTQHGAYEATMERYKRAKRDGTLYRT